MICSTRLAIFAFLKMQGACSLINVILDTDYQPTVRECNKVIAFAAQHVVDYGEFRRLDSEVANLAFKEIPGRRRARFTINILENLMWQWYEDHATQTERAMIWSLYYVAPADGIAELPF